MANCVIVKCCMCVGGEGDPGMCMCVQGSDPGVCGGNSERCGGDPGVCMCVRV